MIPVGRGFYKMSGSGNDFVMVDARTEPPGKLAQAAEIQRLCARGTGVGADGIVFLETSSVADIRLTYLNADGSRADLCGNATLCTTRLAVELGVGAPAGFRIETDTGIVAARMVDGRPEIDLQPVADVRPAADQLRPEAGERRIGYATVGVPHVVIQCDDVSTIDVVGRGRPLRRARTTDGNWAWARLFPGRFRCQTRHGAPQRPVPDRDGDLNRSCAPRSPS